MEQLDLQKFYRACNPSYTLSVANAEDRKYYIDFSAVRGGKIIEQLGRTIIRLSPDEPTCQLFTGHIGCGKSTALLRLQSELEQQGFHVVYFESSRDLDMADVDITDILLSVARQVSESIEKQEIKLELSGFKELLKGLAEVFPSSLDLSTELNFSGDFSTSNSANESEFSLATEVRKLTIRAKDAPNLRAELRQYLEPRTNVILEVLNKELLEPAIAILKQRGKKGLVVIIDNLDRVHASPKPTGRFQPEYLFIDRGEQLKRLNCHVVYTIPLVLIFSSDLGQLTNRFVDPKVLPMVPVQLRDGSPCEEGLALLHQMVMARAFPEVEQARQLTLIPKVFDEPATLNRLCRVSGGHVRNLLQLLYSCLQKEDPPLSRQTLEEVVMQRRHQLILAIEADEWELLHQVAVTKTVSGEAKYQTLLRSLWVFEYRYREDYWFDINPILADAPEFQPGRT